MPQPLEDRFWSKVDKRGPDECWPWKADLTSNGYGAFKLATGKKVRAHRFAWELTHGPIPPGMSACHKCDNPPCCNPGHLFLGTNADNTHDAQKKGRMKGRKGHADFDAGTRLAILTRYGYHGKTGRTMKSLAQELGTSTTEIHRVIHSYGFTTGALNEGDKASIIAEYQHGQKGYGTKSLAKKYGVSPGTIRRVIHPVTS